MGHRPGMAGKQSFEAVVATHGAVVLRVCRAVLGPVDADDAWSETFLSAMTAYRELPADANVAAAADSRDLDLALALRELSDKQKQAVAYHYLAGLPYTDVAAILGGSTDAARRAAADGIATLRRSYPGVAVRRAGP